MPAILGQNLTVPGFSPLYPQAHCTTSGEVCQLTTGEGEINAASTISALIYSNKFVLTKTYFLIAGIAGINPHLATTGSVTFAQYAVQLDLQYEFSASQVPTNDSSGYFPQDAYYPDSPSANDYPLEIYGTEAFEVNKALRDRFIEVASQTKLNDTSAAMAYRKNYGYAPANQPPSVVACSSGTSNVYWSGSVLGDAFYNYTLLLSNGLVLCPSLYIATVLQTSFSPLLSPLLPFIPTPPPGKSSDDDPSSAHYCATQQEDNATLEALLRGALAAKLSFSRIAVMRTASDFDRAPPTESEVFHLLYADQEGFGPSIENIYIAGRAIVDDVLGNWTSVYEAGVKAENYVGDLLWSLKGGMTPDIGTSEIYIS